MDGISVRAWLRAWVRMGRGVSVGVALALLLCAPPAAVAEDDTAKAAAEQAAPDAAKAAPPRAGGLRAACGADIQRLCTNEEGKVTAIGRCLRDNLDDLSQECREQLQRRSRRAGGTFRKIREVCKDDVAKLCADPQGRGGVFRCLRQNEAEASPACREQLAELRKSRPAPAN